MRATRRRGRRIIAAGVGFGLLAASSPIWLPPARAATGGTQKLAASPQSDLADGQFVKLTYSGFAPSVGIAFRQCVPSPAAVATDCTPQNTQVTGVTDATGAGTVYLPVHAGTLPAAGGGTATITCDFTHPCVVAAMPNLTDLSVAAFVQTTFARSKDDCPPTPANELLGAGSSSAYRAMYAWEFAACGPPNNLPVGFTLSNSTDGVANMFNGLTDFAVTGPFATLPTPITPPATPLTWKPAPLTTSAVVLAYRMYDNTGPQITSLTLTPDLIARIFLGQIPDWAANADIKALNPGILFPTRIIPFVRAEHAAQTLVFTSWMAANAGTVWTTGAADTYPIPPSGVQGVTGSTGMGLAVANPLTDFLGQGNIGFMDSSTAAFYGLPTVTIKRADGTLMAPTQSAITQAIVDATANSDGTLALKYADPNPNAYSMAIPTYMLAPTNTIAPDRGLILANFLRYAVQNQGALPAGYAPLPPSLVQQSLTVAAAIPQSAATATPTPTPSPTPTPTPTPRPTPTPTPQPTATPTPLPTTTTTTTLSGSAGGGFSFFQAPVAVVVPGPVPTAAPTPAPTPAPPATPKPAGGVQAASDLPPASADFSHLGDATVGRYLLPLLLGLTVLALATGGTIELLARRRVPLEALEAAE